MGPRQKRSFEPTDWKPLDVTGLAVQWKLTASGIVHFKWEGSAKRSLTLTKDEEASDAPRRVKESVENEPLARAAGAGQSEASSSKDSAGVRAVLEPATQSMDVVSEDEELGTFARLGSPVRCCFGCKEADCEPALDTLDGEFFCGDCVEDPEDETIEAAVREAAEEQLAARTTTTAQSPPQPPVLEPRRSSRPSKPVDPIYDLSRSGPGQPGWSDYEVGRLDARHGRTREETYSDLQAARDKLREEVTEARRERSDLAVEIDRIYGRLRELAKPGDDIELGDCETAAAVILREAIAELADALDQRSESEAAAETAAGSTETAQASVPQEPWIVDGPVRMGGISGAEGQLSIGEAYLSWMPSGLSNEPAQHIPLPQLLFAEIDDLDEVSGSTRRQKLCDPSLAPLCLLQDAELRVELAVHTFGGDTLMLYFERKGHGMLQRSEFMRRLNAAVAAAQIAQDEAAEAVAGRMAAEEQSSTAAPAPKKPRLAAREEQGAQLRKLLREVADLKHTHKIADAQAKLAAAESGEAVGKRTIRNRSGEMADVLFKAGGLDTARAVLDHLLNRKDVRQLLPEATAKTRAEATDAKTARAMLETAKAFFNQLMGRRKWVEGAWKQNKADQDRTWVPGHWVHGGRRTDADRNAFWASAAAMLPKDIFKSRGGKAAMRILGVSYRVIKQGAAYRADMEDRGRGWKLLKTAPHSDRVEGKLITEWWHSEEASTEDNANKQPIHVFHGFDELGERQYEIHWRRARIGSMKECLERFHKSEQAKTLAEQTKTAKRPNGVVVGVKLLKKFRCSCVRVRDASECDDHVTTAAAVNLPKWNRARQNWHREAKEKGVACSCRMHRLAREGDSTLLNSYLSMSKGIGQMEEALLPCGKVAWPAYQLPDERLFKSFYGSCCYGKCPKKGLRHSPLYSKLPLEERPAACGWDEVFGEDCEIECTDDPFEWLEWKQMARGSDQDGQATYAPELVPVRGTRREYLAYQRNAIAAAMPKRYRSKMLRRGLKVKPPGCVTSIFGLCHFLIRTCLLVWQVHEALKPDTTATVWSDYGSQFETNRLYTQTCARRERHNNCPSVVGFAPYKETIKTAARGKRTAKEITVRKQRVFVVYSMFKAGYKPDARSYNV